MKIIYVHGFASTGSAVKAGILRQYFGDDNVLSPTLAVDPDLAIDQLTALIEQLLDQNETPVLVGSSLGGFYSIFLAEKFNLKAALINPAVEAQVRLEEAVGFHRNWHSNEEFEFKESYLDSLAKYYVNKPDCSHYLLLLQEDDELLDYRQAMEHLSTAQTVVKTGGGHHYNCFVDEMERLADFFELVPSKGL